MRLKRESIQHLQGVALLLMGGICHKVGADGAAVFMWLVGMAMLFGKIDSNC